MSFCKQADILNSPRLVKFIDTFLATYIVTTNIKGFLTKYLVVIKDYNTTP